MNMQRSIMFLLLKHFWSIFLFAVKMQSSTVLVKISDARYLVEVENSSGVESHQTNIERLSIATKKAEPLKVKIWTSSGGTYVESSKSL